MEENSFQIIRIGRLGEEILTKEAPEDRTAKIVDCSDPKRVPFAPDLTQP